VRRRRPARSPAATVKRVELDRGKAEENMVTAFE
jgi:hypothetical protein